MSKPAGVICLVLVLSWTSSARAIAPPYLSDEELSASTIIVVAKWEKAAFKSHIRYGHNEQLGRVIERFEAYTKLKVLRTVKGSEIPPGDYELLVNWGVAWSEDGTRVISGTSTETSGDVEDVTKPNLWFLKRTRSWDENRKDEYLSIDNYRQIQPPALEEYFVALGSARRGTLVPRLLAPDKPEVAVRVLRYIAGGIWPWPYDPDEFAARYDNPENRGTVLRAEAARVWAIVKSDARGPRPYAVSVYADLKGKDCLNDIRSLLNDKDPMVRGVAIGVLARHQDAASLEYIQRAIPGVDEGWLACKLIEALSSWGDERVVPCLIFYLQNSSFAYQYGDDLGIPALKARQALKKITGHWFPFDTRRSMNAWQQARHVPDKTKRREFLNKVIPGEEFPFLAELVGQPSYEDVNADRELAVKSSLKATGPGDGVGHERNAIVTVRLRNVTKLPDVIAKRPSGVEMSWPGGSSFYGDDLSKEKQAADNFVTIAPGDLLEFQVKLSELFLIAEPNARNLKVSYRSNGNNVGVNAWIGTLDVKPGAEWKEKRVTAKVEETWPNGNLKVTGTTVNGHKVGEWNYFNEQGDRIRIENPEKGQMSVCNPAHPSNMGAGKRSKN